MPNRAAALSLSIVLAVTACAYIGLAAAANPLGLYVGASAGKATESDDEKSYFQQPIVVDQRHLGWQGFIGLQPSRFLGVELDYINFNVARTVPASPFNMFTESVHPTALGMFAVGYLPLPWSHLKVIEKAGIARLQDSVDQSFYVPFVPAFPPLARRIDHVTTEFAFGAGLQLGYSHFALRAEYERINDADRTPDLLSVGAAWRF